MAKEKFDFIQPIKDIPKTLKGFPKNLVKIWKEPVKDLDQINTRRAEIFPYLYLFGALFLVFFLLYLFIQKIQGIMMPLLFVTAAPIAAGVFLLTVLNKAERKFMDLQCPKCKARIQYGPSVQVKVVNKTFNVGKKKDYMSRVDRRYVDERSAMYCEVTGKEKTSVEVTCKCQECGTQKTFTQEFVTAECRRFQDEIMAKNIDVVMMGFEKDLRAEGAEGFEGKKTGVTSRGVEIKYCPGLKSVVIDYFGDTIQMR